MNVVIAGGGFAGVRAALELSKAQVGRITLVSESRYFQHHEVLQLARMGFDVESPRVTLDELCAEHASIRVVQDTIVSIDGDRKNLVGKAASYEYDELIMALGAESVGSGEKSHDTLARIYAELEKDFEKRHRFDRIISVVGGGQEGVELAGAIREYTDRLSEANKEVSSKISVKLIEKKPMLLSRHSSQAQRKALHRLRSKGVEVQLGTTARVAGKYMVCGSVKTPLQDTLWVNGFTSNLFYVEHPRFFQVDEYGFVDVDPYLEAYPHIYVIGQNIAVRGAMTGKGTLDMADFIVDHLLRVSTGEHPLPYRPTSSITSIITDSRWAYIECFGVYITGRLGRSFASRLENVNIRKIMSPTVAKIFVARSTTKMSNL